MKKLKSYTDTFSTLKTAFETLYFETTNSNYPIRKINIGFGNIINKELSQVQLSLFEENDNSKENNLQKAVVKIKNKFGKKADPRLLYLPFNTGSD